MKIIGIMACDPHGVMGAHQKIPWHYPEELQHFRSVTQGKSLIMGRKTFESIPRSTLQACECIVFSHHPIDFSGLRGVHVASLGKFLKCVAREDQIYYMVGGAQMAQLFLQEGLLDEFLLTRIHTPHAGDCFLPLNFFKAYSPMVLRETKDFTIYQYRLKA